MRLVLSVLVAFGVLAGTSTAHDKKGKQPKKIDPHWFLRKAHKGPHTFEAYECARKEKEERKRHRRHGEVYDLSVTALRGPAGTDVYLSIETDDPQKYPIPEEFKKLQIKILNGRHKTAHLKNLRHVAIENGEAVVSVEKLFPGMEISVQAEIKAHRRKEEVLRASGTVLLRPDLTVKEVHAPAEIAPDTPFNIEGVIQEKNMQSDVTANVSLWEGSTLLSTASGVYVPAGEQVSVIFEAVTFSDAGQHDLTMKITDAMPAEYATDNNELAFSVLVTNPVQALAYTLNYYVSRNYSQVSRTTYCADVSETRNEGSYASWDMYTTLPFLPVAPIDSIRWESISGNGTLSRIFMSDLTPSVSNPTVDYYTSYIQDEDGSYFYLDLYVYKTLNQAFLNFTKIANNYVYVSTSNSDTTYFFDAEHSLQGDIEGFLEVRVLLADDGQMTGGSARADNITFQPYSSSDLYSDMFGGCLYESLYTVSYEQASGSVAGMTNPAGLPSASVKSGPPPPALALSALPQTADVVQNYPNPFNPSTNVQFTVEHSGPAVLRVYDMLGKEVLELFRGEAEQGRTYRFTFQGANFASGMYYAMLETGGRRVTKKMLLMK